MAKPGPKNLPNDLKRQQLNIKLPPFIIEFLRTRDKSQSDVIIEALICRYPELINGLIERVADLESLYQSGFLKSQKKP